MSNSERGRRTGQHEQKEQQAYLTSDEERSQYASASGNEFLRKPEHHAVMFTAFFADDYERLEPGELEEDWPESIDRRSPFPVPPLKLTYIVSAIDTKPWDIEQYVDAMFTENYPDRKKEPDWHGFRRIQIDYEVECDGCALVVSSARTRYIGDGKRVLCPDCEEKFSDQILETKLRDIAEEDSCDS